jgi:regulatory protein
MAFGKLTLKGRALRCLAQREHSRSELERKLARHVDGDGAEPAQAQIAALLDELASHGLLSEARVAQSVLLSQGRRFGTRRLKQTLMAKGLPTELVAQTLQQARATELERAREVWRRRFGMAPVDAKDRARQARFLAARGFAGEVIHRIVQGQDDESA